MTTSAALIKGSRKRGRQGRRRRPPAKPLERRLKQRGGGPRRSKKGGKKRRGLRGGGAESRARPIGPSGEGRLAAPIAPVPGRVAPSGYGVTTATMSASALDAKIPTKHGLSSWNTRKHTKSRKSRTCAFSARPRSLYFLSKSRLVIVNNKFSTPSKYCLCSPSSDSALTLKRGSSLRVAILVEVVAREHGFRAHAKMKNPTPPTQA